MKLDEYKDFAEKKKVYYHDTIDTVDEFDSWIISFEEIMKNRFIYRGSNEAKYKNYTYAQRDWITNEWSKVLNISYVDYVDKLLGHIRKDKLLTTYLSSLDIAHNDILYLSFMQHYAMPSPLLDFTKDLRTALFFAIDGMKHDPTEKEIENYFSIYAIEPTIEYVPADTLFGNAIRDANEMVGDFMRKHPDASVNVELLKSLDLLTKWKKTDGTKGGLYEIPLMFIPNPLDAAPVINIAGQRLYWSNPNIIAQQGCFIMNSSETDVLEDVVARNEYMKQVTCIDIHKSLADYIKKNYINHLNQDVIYPKFKKIADKAYEDFKAGL